jgi:hypothetical protein
MAQNVLFKIGTRAQFDAIVTKSETTLYWLSDTQELYKGDVLFGKGALASEEASGLLSAEDYKKLKELIATGGAVELTPVNGSIVIEDKKIGVGLSAVEGNMLSIKGDGLFVAPVDLTDVQNRLTAVEGSIAQLQEDIIGGIRYKGAVATIDDLPVDAKQGDLYEVTDDGSEWCYNGKEWFEYGSAHFTPVAGSGIQINGNEIAIKIADNANGLVAVEGGLSINIATKDSAGALSAVDKAFIDSIPDVYATKNMVEDTAVQVKYEITGTPEGSLVNYGDKEIRVMCHADAKFVKQSVGTGGDANTYYMTFRAYVPNNNVVGYIEHLGNQVDEEILTTFSVDEHGRKYQTTWLGLAKFDETTGTWTYYGANSTFNKMIGWDYQIDWYDANNKMIASDCVRINLTNESCHNYLRPYYGPDSDISTDITEIQKTIDEIQEMYSWGEM